MRNNMCRFLKGISGLAFCLFLLAACSSPAPTPTPTELPPEYIMYEVTYYYGSATASVNERIQASDVVVRATLVTATDEVLTFNAIEYLKGSGPSRFTVPASAGRNATWDDREAVLFLTAGVGGGTTQGRAAQGKAAPTFQFADTTVSSVITDRGYTGEYDGYRGGLPEGNEVDSRNPVWVPSTSEGTSGRASVGTGSGELISHGNPVETLTLADLKAKIAWIEGGDGSESYRQCIIDALDNERDYRDEIAFSPGSYDFPIDRDRDSLRCKRRRVH